MFYTSFPREELLASPTALDLEKLVLIPFINVYGSF